MLHCGRSGARYPMPTAAGASRDRVPPGRGCDGERAGPGGWAPRGAGGRGRGQGTPAPVGPSGRARSGGCRYAGPPPRRSSGTVRARRGGGGAAEGPGDRVPRDHPGNGGVRCHSRSVDSLAPAAGASTAVASQAIIPAQGHIRMLPAGPLAEAKLLGTPLRSLGAPSTPSPMRCWRGRCSQGTP